MEVIRRNTDYAFRLMAQLAKDFDKSVAASKLAKDTQVSYQLCCKLLQKLSAAGLVESKMGINGGYRLTDKPCNITLRRIVEAIQGPIIFNMCLKSDVFECPMAVNCPVRNYLGGMQADMNKHLENKTLASLLEPG
jgi:Rrf2 family protein